MNPTAKPILRLFAGAMAIGLAPVFVKQLVAIGGVSPVAAGFWRMAVGSIGFFVMMLISASNRTKINVFRLERSYIGPILMAGVMFACDLAAWHTSFKYTTVAASTLIANLSAVFVPLCGVLWFKERTSKALYLGGFMAIVGVVGLTLLRPTAYGDSHQHSIAMGEGLALLTAFFYTGYMLAMKRLTMRMPSTMAMAYSSAISAVILLAVVFFQTDVLIPKSVEGWTYLLGLGLVSQLLGQGLIASAMTILPVGMSALLLLSAPTSTALFGWLFLNEKMSMGQVISVSVTLAGIGIVALR